VEAVVAGEAGPLLLLAVGEVEGAEEVLVVLGFVEVGHIVNVLLLRFSAFWDPIIRGAVDFHLREFFLEQTCICWVFQNGNKRRLNLSIHHLFPRAYSLAEKGMRHYQFRFRHARFGVLVQ